MWHLIPLETEARLTEHHQTWLEGVRLSTMNWMGMKQLGIRSMTTPNLPQFLPLLPQNDGLLRRSQIFGATRFLTAAATLRWIVSAAGSPKNSLRFTLPPPTLPPQTPLQPPCGPTLLLFQAIEILNILTIQLHKSHQSTAL